MAHIETKSDAIRRLARGGMARADIARELGIRYQHVYNVLKMADTLPARGGSRPVRTSKPPLTASVIQDAGFARVSRWLLKDPPSIELEENVFREPGVYAFVLEDRAIYVGLASMGLSKRLYFYAKPGSTQRTSQRLNALIAQHCADGRIIDVYAAKPDDFSWNGLPVDGCAGLELGLIKHFDLPWNVRSAG